jgi:hypothetical protein
MRGAWNMKIRMQQPVKVIVEHDLAKSIMEILKLEDKWRVMVVLDQFLMGVPAVQEMIAEIHEITLSGNLQRYRARPACQRHQ